MIAKASLEEVRHAIIKDLMISSIFTEEYVRKLQDLASKSVGVADYPTSYFRYNIKIMRFYQSMVNDLKKELSIALKKTIYYPLVDQFGFNEISVAKIVGEVGDIRRFSNHKKFVSYCGFDVSEKQSGGSQSKNCFITKQGNRILRTTFVLLTLCQLRYKTDLKVFFDRLKGKGKHGKQCMVATARKLAVKTYFNMQKCHEN